MTDREKKLLAAARTARIVLAIASRQLTQDHKAVLGGKNWGDSALRKLDIAIAAYEPPPVTEAPQEPDECRTFGR